MGINLVVGCPKHRERMWIFRGHEAAALDVFFSEHAHCGELAISHDQSDEGWVSVGGIWGETTFPAMDEA